ncbi:MAG: hypothetical protein ACK54I_00415, partial [Planctomycetota bacterium]
LLPARCEVIGLAVVGLAVVGLAVVGLGQDTSARLGRGRSNPMARRQTPALRRQTMAGYLSSISLGS